MPKIIENVREQLLSEAKKQIAELGYSKTTIRSVAKACGLGTGTVYNYFPSKDMLIATVMAEDWKLCLKQLEERAFDESERIVHGIYDCLCDLIHKYRECIFLHQGKIEEEGAPEQLFGNPQSPRLQQFLKGSLK